jgi:ribosomal protein S13
MDVCVFNDPACQINSFLTSCSCVAQALAIKDGGDFQHILRILGTNVDGKQKVMYAMCSVKGIGRRFSNIVCKKADVDMDKRAGELTQKEMDDLVNVVQNPNEYKIPSWMLNRRKDFKVRHLCVWAASCAVYRRT